jgi:LysR family transcriptional regulator, glycine cleavage system transcriptional activator
VSWHLPPLNAVRTFEAAGRNLSFTLAARELNVTPGAVSRQIKLLEEFIGARLFERANREVKLTRAGALYLEDLTEAFSRINAATACFAESRGDQTLRLSSSITLTLRWLIPRLITFHAVNPGAQVQLTTSLKPVDFRIDDVDLAIRLGSGDWPNSVKHLLMRSELVPVCSPNLLKDRPLRAIGDLAAHTLLHSTARPRNWPIWLRGAGNTDLECDKGIFFESSSLALQAAIEGMGIAIAQPPLVSEDLQAGRLVTPFDRIVTEDDAFYILYAEGAMRNKMLQRFRDWLLKQAGTPPHVPSRVFATPSGKHGIARRAG